MRASTRLRLCFVVVFLSVIYGILISRSLELARTLAMGYIAIVLTIFLLVQFWRKP